MIKQIKTLDDYRDAVRDYFFLFAAILDHTNSSIFFTKAAQVNNQPSKIWLGNVNAHAMKYKEDIDELRTKWLELKRKSNHLQSADKKQIVIEELKKVEDLVTQAVQTMLKEIIMLENQFKQYPKSVQREDKMTAAYMQLGVVKRDDLKEFVRFWTAEV